MFKNDLESLFKMQTHRRHSPSLPWCRKTIPDAGGALSAISNVPQGNNTFAILDFSITFPNKAVLLGLADRTLASQ